MAIVKKISELTPKGSALASTDLLVVGVDNGSDYDLKSVTGAQLLGTVVSQTITDGITTKSPSEDAVFEKLKEYDSLSSSQNTSTAIRFDKKFIHADTDISGKFIGLTGNVTVQTGVGTLNVNTQSLLIHNHSSIPTFSSEFIKAQDSLDYKINVDNYVICTLINQNPFKVSYRIVRDANDLRLITSAESTLLGNTSGTNTGDQDLSTYATDSSVVKLTTNQTIADQKTFSSNTVHDLGLRIKHGTSSSVIGYTGIGAGENQLNIGLLGAVQSLTFPSTANYNYNFPSATGTLSLTSDLTSKVDSNTAITGATKTKITYDSKGLVTNGTDATTVDIADSSNKRYVTDANLTVISNTSGTNTGDQTFLNARVQTVTSSATVTPTSTNDLVIITAQAAGLTLANPTGTFTEGQALMIRIKDDATARSIAFDTNYRAIGVTLPTTTVISKTLYLGIIYNATDSKFDVIGYNIQA